MSDAQPRVGSALIVQDEDNRILLGKRNKDPQRGRWVLPGGKIRPFESIAEAAARELEEETGLKVQVRGQFRVYEVINPPSEHRIVIYSYARAAGGVIRAADDISEVRFVGRGDQSRRRYLGGQIRPAAGAGCAPPDASGSPGAYGRELDPGREAGT